VWPAIEYSLKGIVIAELQMDLYVNGSYMKSVSDQINYPSNMNWAIGLICGGLEPSIDSMDD
jgi:hypothetical protein